MYFKQFYLGCLAHGSYLLGSDGEGVVIDPQRDVDQYIEDAKREGLSIKYIIETHLHADFVSGHRELSEKTGAQIVFGEKSGAAFPHIAVKDGDVLKIGAITLSILETPGHTPESICILAKDGSDQEPAKLFSGDTLFIGDVGRPDLVGSKGFSDKEMAGLMYESLHGKLLKLPDDVEVFPAHGAGSLCGKHLSNERSSTIGQQKQFNYALKPMSKEAFVEMLTADQPEVPAYFPKDVEINRLGASPLESLSRPLPFTSEVATKELQRGAVILDVRTAAEHASGNIKGSLHIGLGGQFASWAGTLIQLGTPIILLANDQAQVDESVVRLARVGIESVIGHLQHGISSWDEADFESAQSSVISVAELKRAIDADEDLLVVDVRRSGEYDAGHVPKAINIPLAELSGRVSELPADGPMSVICASGYRSSIAKSILERAGVKHVMDVLGGTTAWKNADYGTQRREAVPTR
ncbi:MAG: rhodanese-like domain-containing protein [Candidatus Melainabacteria bacterium]|nr:rhodanese-like domain-containing protein [Candidatus Melainabacteria bacterium]